MVTPPDETTADPYAVIATLRAERDAALAREAALDEVLDLINRSPAEAQPVFDKILEKAHSLCDAAMGALLLYSNELIWAVATRGYSGAAGALARQPRPLAPEQQGLALGQRVVQITGEQSLHDVNSSFGRAFVELTGARTYLMVPLRKDGELLGAISVVRQEVRPFSEQDIALLERFAEQAVIAMENTRLVTELRQRTDELARRNSEYGERIDHQAAMIEVLKVMSASPGETQPVFDLIVRQAQSQCNSASAALYEFDGMIHCRSFASSVLSSDAIEAYFRQFPMPLQQTSNHSLTVSIRDRRIVHIRDASAAEEVSTVSRDQGVESAIVVPLITPDGAAGCIALSELRPGGYSDAQIALLQTFAEQAVIAITSAETYRALQTRTTDLQETLEYQTAISDVLKVIGGSTFDLQPVFDTIVTTAAQLCEAGYANITIRENDGFRVVAGYSNLPDRPFWGIGRSFPVDRNSITGRTVLAQQFVHLIDVTLDPEFALLESARRSGMRSILGVPLMRDGIVVGTLNLGRVQVRPFTGRQIDLIRTFADQAVIAIENTRLLTEQREALDQQTATADVLQVINSSPGNLVPVFDAMLEKAMRLCGAAYGVLRSFDSEHLDTLASRGVPSEYAAFLARNADLNKLGANASTTSLTQALRTCQPTQILDVREGIAYKGGSPGSVAIADIGGARTILHVPLVKDLTSVGLFTIYRQEVRAFSDKQVALLENFAAQAVVAMENARLLTEQREALEQQTATAEVLQVINASPGDLAPVFDAMLEKALRLCEAAFGIINTYDGELFHPVAMRSPPALEDTFRSAPNLPRASRHSGLRRIVLGEDVVQIEDLAADPAYQEGEARRVIEAAGAHSYLGVALRLEGKLLGTIGTYRQEVRPFSDKQIALLQNFAAQAVIAMENARLLGELRQRTNDLQESLEYQTATSDVLKVISRSTFDLQPVLTMVAETTARLCVASRAAIFSFDAGMVRLVANIGFPPDYQADFDARGLVALDPASPGVLPRAARERRAVHIHDAAAIPGYSRAAIELGNVRTALGVPLLREGEPIGVIVLSRQRVEPFTERQIELVSTFADQAVIAIENTRLITEQREALEQQTATTEVLQVINISPGELAPVFDAMLEKATRLCNAAFGLMSTYDGRKYQTVATHGIGPELAEFMRDPPHPDPESALGRIEQGEDLVLFDDIADTDVYRRGGPRRRAIVELGGARSYAVVALRKDGRLLGIMAAYRRQVRPFEHSQVALLQNFASQAVIAMENARLINETREALEQQTATAEVLQVINASPGNLAPVFDAVLERALRLCGASFGTLLTYDGEHLKRVAFLGVPTAFIEYDQRNPLTKNAALVAEGIATGKTVQAADIMTDARMATSPRVRDALVELGGVRALLQVPLVKDGAMVGFIAVWRREPGSFPDKQVALVEGFAAQAVIAMENARLITETRQALEQQTATAEVLQVINTSPGDLLPVFDAILDKAHALCGATVGALSVYRDGQFHALATHGFPEQIASLMRHPIAPNSLTRELICGARYLQIEDHLAIELDPDHEIMRAMAEYADVRTVLFMPLRKESALLGFISANRLEVRPFSDREIALLENFAAQAVIAMENARLITETREALEQQTATAEVLRTINENPGNLGPVFDVILEKALSLAEAAFGSLWIYHGDTMHAAATRGMTPALAEFRARNPVLAVPPVAREASETRRAVQMLDIRESESYRAGRRASRAIADLGGARTNLVVPLLKVDEGVGCIQIYRQEVRVFTPQQISLLEGFAAQAVIAMENARLLTELRQRTEELAQRNSEYGERIEQQAATIDVLEAMSASSGDAQPVFQVIVERARAFCNADNANLALVDGDMLHVKATTIIDPREDALYMAQFPRPVDATSMFGRAILARDAVQTPDVSADTQHFQRTMSRGAMPRPLGLVAVPLLRAGAPIGAIVLARNTPGEFSATQVELLRTFAEQAVIAVSSAETFKELQRRTADLTRSVAELQALEEVLRAVNSSLDLETVLATIISRAVQLSDADEGTIYEFDDLEQVFVPKSAYGMTDGRVTALRNRRIRIGETPLGNSAAMRAPLHIRDLRQAPDVDGSRTLVGDGIHALLAVPLLRDEKVLGGLVIRRREAGGFAPTVPTLLQTFAGQCVLAIENARLFRDARQARVEAEETLADLRRTQDRLVQSEKMASLGQLTAGIAHEIKNPLNFVNNFASLSVDLLDELKQTAAPSFAMLDEERRAEIDDLTQTLSSNLEKINEHGRRADGIVRSMLEHSRSSSGERRSVDLNALVDEALNLAYHGARAQDQTFNITLQRDLGEGIPPITLAPQDVTRVLLNLFSNGFYAARRRQSMEATQGFEPALKVVTRELGDAVEIGVRDNGIGIAVEIRSKLFQPFFTTKPTGEGTGLGLSISYDIVTQQHGGSITVDSKVGEYSEFVVRLPRKP